MTNMIPDAFSSVPFHPCSSKEMETVDELCGALIELHKLGVTDFDIANLLDISLPRIWEAHDLIPHDDDADLLQRVKACLLSKQEA